MNSQQPIAMLTSTGFLLDNQLQNLSFKLNGSQVTIGRSPHNDIFINNRKLSQQHARLTCASGQWEIEDQDSTNSVYVNQEKISASRRLQPGDRVSFGGIEFTFELKKQPLVLRQDSITKITKQENYKPDATIYINNTNQPGFIIKQIYALYYWFFNLWQKFKLR